MNKIIKYTLFAAIMAMFTPMIGHTQETTDTSIVQLKASFDIYDRLIRHSDDGSEIVINQDSRVETQMKQHFDRGNFGKNLRGYRIRVYRDNARNARERSAQIVNSFKGSYPGVPVYRTYTAPTWYIEVGDYRTRDDAEKMKKELIKIYPGASLIEGTINFPPL